MICRTLGIVSILMLRILSTKSFRPLTLGRIRVPSRSLTTTTQLGEGSPRKSGGARQKERKRRQQEGEGTSTLEWEKFDFSDSPKWDKRFDKDGSIHVAESQSQEGYERLIEEETKQDSAFQEEVERQHKLWDNLDPKLVEDATNVLLPWIQAERWERIQSLLQKRTQQTRFLFENPANPSNVWACLRTLDSFGIQHVDVVIQSGEYKGKAALSQKRGMRTAVGSAKWLTLKNHLSTENALETMKREDYHIVYTDVNPTSKDIRDVDWDASGKKLCVVMGNEQYGISDAVKEMADESFYLPMVGMAESFNLSVATSITCAHLSAASGHGEEGTGPLRPGDLSEQEVKTLLLKGALNSARPKLSRALFLKNDLKFPKELNLT